MQGFFWDAGNVCHLAQDQEYIDEAIVLKDVAAAIAAFGKGYMELSNSVIYLSMMCIWHENSPCACVHQTWYLLSLALLGSINFRITFINYMRIGCCFPW